MKQAPLETTCGPNGVREGVLGRFTRLFRQSADRGHDQTYDHDDEADKATNVPENNKINGDGARPSSLRCAGIFAASVSEIW